MKMIDGVHRVLVTKDIIGDVLDGKSDIGKSVDLLKDHAVEVLVTTNTIDVLAKSRGVDSAKLIKALKEVLEVLPQDENIDNSSLEEAKKRHMEIEASLIADILYALEAKCDAILFRRKDTTYEVLFKEVAAEKKTDRKVQFLIADAIKASQPLGNPNQTEVLKPSPAGARSTFKWLIFSGVVGLVFVTFSLLLWLTSRPEKEIISSEKEIISPKNTSPEFNLPIDYTPLAGTQIKVGGSVSMRFLNRLFKSVFEEKYLGVEVKTGGWDSGSNDGINKLCAGTIDIAAISAPLESLNESCAGLQFVEIATGALTLVVSPKNPIDDITKEDLSRVFQCTVDDWSDVGGTLSEKIKVTNRADKSGTRNVLQDLVLLGQSFCPSGSLNFENFNTRDVDEISQHAEVFQPNEISYMGYYHATNNRESFKILKVDGVHPSNSNYPYQRPLFYVYKEDASEPIRAFLAAALTEARR